jgi:phosphatidylethanolamine/phosphatidyl-N-methylethanolamine N-methyltransferase
MNHTNVSHQRWHDHRLFLSHFRKSPRTVGAIAPSSQRLARTMLAGLTLEAGARLVELGPGTGAVTGEIAKRLPPGARCLAIDIDPVFVARISSRWPQIAAVCDRAEHLVQITRAHDMQPVDHIVSGLPFASLPASTTRQVVDAIVEALRPGGTFTTFQYVHAFAFPSAMTVRRALTRKMGSSPSRTLVMGNIPPALVLRWRKTPGPSAPATLGSQRDSA